MSALLAVATAAPTVVQHPIIQTVTKYVVENHTQIVSGATQLLAFGTGMGASFLHQLIERDKLGPKTNILIVQVYSIVLALLDLFVKGQLNASLSPAVLLAEYGLVLAGSQVFYHGLQLLQTNSQPSPTAAASTAAVTTSAPSEY